MFKQFQLSLQIKHHFNKSSIVKIYDVEILRFRYVDYREIKHNVTYVKWQTAKMMKRLPSVCSCLYSRVNIYLYLRWIAGGSFSLFVWFSELEEKNTNLEQTFAICRLPYVLLNHQRRSKVTLWQHCLDIRHPTYHRNLEILIIIAGEP